MEWMFSNDLAMTGIVSAAALAAVWLPFSKGLAVAFRALRATRRVRNKELRRMLAGSGGGREPMAVLLLRVLRKSLRESAREAWPSEFVVDAARQYVMNEYETYYARPLSMYANLLPPIGFIGTTAGLLLIFLSMHLADDTLELGALAAALTSSVFALVAFAVLESAKIRLYARLLAALNTALEIQQDAEAAAGTPSRRLAEARG